MTWRRAQMVLLSAQGMDAVKIAKVTFTSPNRVRDVLHNFNADGFDSLAHGRSVMQRLQARMAGRWPVGLLSMGQAKPFYEALGWERWRGVSYARTAQGVERNP